MWVLILTLGVVALFIYFFFTSTFDYWKQRGVPHPSISRLFGNVGETLIFLKSLSQVYDEIYWKYPSLAYIGFYRIRQPGIIIKDPELIKEILVKNFSSFEENDLLVDEDLDPLLSKDPFLISGEKWKVARSHQAPCFTGNKVKAMYPLMEAASSKLITFLEGVNLKEINAKELMGKYTIEVVASTAFGLEANCFADPNSEFRKMCKNILSQSFLNTVKNVLQLVIPSLAKILKIQFVPNDAAHYFRKIISETLQYRKEHNIIRNDFLNTMIEFKQKLGEDVFSDEAITANAVGLIFDAFETTSVTLTFALYELGANPDIQYKLKTEIDEILENNGGILNYDAIQKMVYLDKIYFESLRMHPPETFLGKTCTKPFTLPSPIDKGQAVVIEPETIVVVPVYSLHYDPKYYPDPERFDPERFSEENIQARQKYTYLPFGEGPRMCLGQRFAAAQVKIAIAKLVLNFEIRVNKKTITPLQIDPTYFILAAKGGIWLDFYRRSR